VSSDEPDYSDVLIVGAGFSGIGAAYRIREKNPGLSYTGSCSATPAFGPTATSSRCASRGSHGRDPR
jgi:succinate dehydrogenase/fumarate reductase flavoprotein subunit